MYQGIRNGALTAVRFTASAVLGAALFSLFAATMFAQKGGSHPPPAPVLLPKPSADSFEHHRLINDIKSDPTSPQGSGEENTCFLPPLNGVHNPTVTVANLQVGTKARKEYQAACDALKDKKLAAAEAHLRKAVQMDPKYSAAWVTLGQMLAAQQLIDQARDACSQGLTTETGYLPRYLCLGEIAVREQKWDEALKFSSIALDMDPVNDALAYGYSAVANLNLHKLAEAEKNALRALEIDKNNGDPRLHFLLAQIYEAKGDAASEAVQLREYLKFAGDPGDAAMVQKYLSDLERQAGK
jgi:tetratricopeptide (TPR) repeat protein